MSQQQEHELQIKTAEPENPLLEASMLFRNDEPHILLQFLKEEVGTTNMELALIASLLAVVCTLFVMAVNKKI